MKTKHRKRLAAAFLAGAMAGTQTLCILAAPDTESTQTGSQPQTSQTTGRIPLSASQRTSQNSQREDDQSQTSQQPAAAVAGRIQIAFQDTENSSSKIAIRIIDAETGLPLFFSGGNGVYKFHSGSDGTDIIETGVKNKSLTVNGLPALDGARTYRIELAESSARDYELSTEGGRDFFEAKASTMSNVTLDLIRKEGSLQALLRNKDGTPIKNIAFTLYRGGASSIKVTVKKQKDGYTVDKTANDSLKTDSKGWLKISGLSVGEDYLLCVSPEAGLDLQDRSEYSFRLNATGETHKVSLTHYEAAGGLQILVEKENGKPLTGTRYTIMDAAGETMRFVSETNGYEPTSEEDIGSRTVSTDKNGKIRINNLKPGVYTVVETMNVSGYEKTNNQNVEVAGDETAALTITKKSSLGSLKILVKDALNHKELGGYAFALENEDGEAILFEKTENGGYICSMDGDIKSLSVDEKGASVRNLPKGNYYIRQTRAPQGYILNKNKTKIQIQAGKTASYQTEASRSNTSLTLKDKNGRAVSGIEVEIFNGEDGERHSVFKGTTNENGRLLISGVASGSYSCKLSVPSPYVPVEEELNFFIAENGSVEGLEQLVLETNSLQVQSAPAAGAVFQLASVDDTETYLTAATNDEGLAEFKDIPDGSYILTQTEAAPGFIKDKGAQEVRFTRKSQPYSVFQIYNEQEAQSEQQSVQSEVSGTPVKEKDKKDNTIWIILSALAALALASFAGLFIWLKKKSDPDDGAPQNENETAFSKEISELEEELAEPDDFDLQEEDTCFEEYFDPDEQGEQKEDPLEQNNDSEVDQQLEQDEGSDDEIFDDAEIFGEEELQVPADGQDAEEDGDDPESDEHSFDGADDESQADDPKENDCGETDWDKENASTDWQKPLAETADEELEEFEEDDDFSEPDEDGDEGASDLEDETEDASDSPHVILFDDDDFPEDEADFEDDTDENGDEAETQEEMPGEWEEAEEEDFPEDDSETDDGLMEETDVSEADAFEQSVTTLADPSALDYPCPDLEGQSASSQTDSSCDCVQEDEDDSMMDLLNYF